MHYLDKYNNYKFSFGSYIEWKGREFMIVRELVSDNVCIVDSNGNLFPDRWDNLESFQSFAIETREIHPFIND